MKMSINTQRICYNCFQEKSEGEGPCPYCGFDLKENEEQYPVALKAGALLKQRYLVGRVLGQGGFGITYVAWDTKLQARVAVKEYMPSDICTRLGNDVSVAMESKEEEFAYGRERFQEEARILAKFMGQPNIAGVTDYFDENGTSYFVMDYIEGISFKAYIAGEGGKVSVEEALDVMIPVLRALTAVHAEGLIHRDVTPDNIYITKDGNVKLLDFGSARYSLGDKSKSLDVILKVGYAPKEQYIRRGRQGPYTDVYSCAACLYAAITGYLPPESLDRLEKDELVPPSRMGVEIPLYLERAILKGLAVQPEDRFQTAGEFLEAIESQQVVELPGRQEEASQPQEKEPPRQKTSKALVLGALAVTAAALALGVHALMGGGNGGSATDSPAAEASLAQEQAPKVMIGGQEYSTALEQLDLSEQNLTDGDLISLGEMTSLKELNLEGNSQISDLTPLGELASLESLYLPIPSEVTDLSPIAGLNGLKTLSIQENQSNAQPVSKIQDYSPIASLKNLEELDLSVTNLKDLSFVSGLSGLKSLSLVGSLALPDLTALKDLSQLETLDIYAGGLGNPAGIEGLTQLRHLELGNESTAFQMEDLFVLSGLTNLEYLRVDADGISSFHGMEQLANLKEAYFWGSSATYQDVSPLAGLTDLQILRLPGRSGGSNLAPYSADGLAGLSGLRELAMDSAAQSLEPLRNLTGLTKLSIAGNSCPGAFQSLEPLSGLTGLQSLDVQFCRSTVIDLAPLSGLTQLASLSVESFSPSDPVENLAALSGLTNLKNLVLNLPSLTDLSPLSSLTGLQSANITAPGVSDWPPLSHVPVVRQGE